MKNSQLSIILSIILLCLAVPAWAQQYEFKAEGDSQQINLPDNQGTVNINQYYLNSEDYRSLKESRDYFIRQSSLMQQFCEALEREPANAELLRDCRKNVAVLNIKKDSVETIIFQFKEDVLRLAQTFERIPLNSERLRLAKELFDAGKFREVDAIMNLLEMTQEGEALLASRERFQSGLQETDSLLQIKAEEFVVKAQAKAVDYTDPKRIDSTALCYLQALRYNDNSQTLLDLAYFFSDNHQYDSALVYFPKVIAHPKADDWQFANAYSAMGNMYSATGNLPAALDAYTLSFKRCETLHQSEPGNTFYKENLAVSYSKLGETHTALGNLSQALTFFEKDLELSKELHEAYPQNVSFKNGLAISYEQLGETHTDLGNLSQALTFFGKDLELSKELHEAYPQKMDFKNGLAIAYEKLGSTYTALGNLTQALISFEERSRLGKELYEAYPQNMDFKEGLAISYSKLGSTYAGLDNLLQALTFFEQYNTLEKELYEAYPQNVYFKEGLAISYAKLGETHTALGNLPQALTFFEEMSKLFKELHEAYPQNVSFKNGLAISYEKLGSTHTALGHLPQALTFFEHYNQLEKELHQADPLNVEFKNGLAISYYQLGAFSRDQLKDVLKAKNYFQQAEQLWVELVRDAPEHEQFKRLLGILRGEMMKLEE